MVGLMIFDARAIAREFETDRKISDGPTAHSNGPIESVYRNADLSER
jgi:hypothetical protein